MINMIKIESIQLNHSKWPTGKGADYGFLINKNMEGSRFVAPS